MALHANASLNSSLKRQHPSSIVFVSLVFLSPLYSYVFFLRASLQDGDTALLEASDEGYNAVVELLLVADANTETQDGVCFIFEAHLMYRV